MNASTADVAANMPRAVTHGADAELMSLFRAFYTEVVVLRQELEAGGATQTPIVPSSRDTVTTDAAPEGSELQPPRPPTLDTPLRSLKLTKSNDPEAQDRIAAQGTGALSPTDTTMPTGPPADAVATRLAGVLERQVIEMARHGGDLAARRFREVQYVMAALADEIFLHDVRWAGREQWTSHLLERRLFGSYEAGDEVFRRAQALLAHGEGLDIELAMVYFSALALDFQGKYRGLENRAELDALKRRLYRFVFGQEPALSAQGRHASPNAYAHTLRSATRRDLPYLMRWLKVGVVGLILFLLLGHLLFDSAVSELDRELARPVWSTPR